MIDVENIVVTQIKNAVEAEFLSDYPGLKVYSYPIARPESFPCVTIIETDNYTYRPSQEFGKLRENHTNATYELSVYTNNGNGKKALAKAIFKVADEVMQDLRFTRIMAMPVENIDRTIARHVGRYSGIIGEGITTIVDGVETTLFPVFRT